MLSSLCALSNQYIAARDNAALLDDILDHLLAPRLAEGARPAVSETVTMQPEPRPGSVLAPVPRETARRSWQEALADLIAVWDGWDACWAAFHEACRKTERATSPRDAAVLIEAWVRDIEHWQPRLIDYARQEIGLWDEIKRSEYLPEDVFDLVHALQINRSMALAHRQQHLAILERQLEAMHEGDKQRVDALLEEDLRQSKAIHLLGNDCARLLRALSESGLPIPEKHIPEIEAIRDEAYEVASYLVQDLVPVPMPGMARTADPWRSDYEAWMQARHRADAAGDALERYSNTVDFYLDVMRDVRQQTFD